MKSGNPSLRVPIALGEQTRKALLDVGLLNKSLQIRSENKHLLIPTTRLLSHDEIAQILGHEDFEISYHDFEEIYGGPTSLAEVLEDKLSSEEIELLPRAYDLIGDIAVLEIPEELSQYSIMIGEGFRIIHKNFAVVLSKKGAISGTKRVREYDILAGENRTDTIHTEYGCKIAVDLAKAYFSPRLLEEHNRIAEQVSHGECVLDMFTGVGPFALHIAKRVDAKVIAIDINPEAIHLLEKSIRMNKLTGEVHPVVADSKEYVKNNFEKDIDRVIMNHPSGAGDFVESTCHALRDGGILHYYDFMGGEDPESSMISRLSSLVEAAGRKVESVPLVRRVRDSAPFEYQMVVDAIIQ
ncbi:MAG: tRNA (Guanine(37)-N1)-methyltransferase Trm5b [Candidatus Thorarchaeota archaeon]|nr:MAG: tRNA (Guanine(37)-N1)-methyltransferase Trm5b [Candidatus Thorarchaeota archaeon]